MVPDRLRRIVHRLLLNVVAASYLVPNSVRLMLMRACGVHVGVARVFSGSIFRTTQLSIGHEVFINHRCLFDAGPVELGDQVYVADNVTFASGDHELGDARRRAGTDVVRPIVVGSGTWIGSRAVVLGGVTIAPGCVIAAGAVVTVDTEPNGLYAGVPARLKRRLPG